MRESGRERLSQAVAIAAAVFGAAVFTVLAWEFGLRLLRPQPLYAYPPGLFVSDPRVGFRMTPNVRGRHNQPDFSYLIETDALGLREPAPPAKPSYTVLVVGDSVPYGMGVEEERTAVDLFRKHLQGSRPSAAVINTAVPGYTLTNERALTEEAVAGFHPDLVLHFFSWHTFGARESLKVSDGRLVLSEGQRFGALRAYLNQHSHLFTLIKRAYYAGMAANSIEPEALPAPADVDWACEQIQAMRRAALNGHARLVTVLNPFEGPVAPAFDAARADFAARLRKVGGEVFDLEPDFRRLSLEDRKKLSFSHDRHWNAEGNRFVAEVLIREFGGKPR